MLIYRIQGFEGPRGRGVEFCLFYIGLRNPPVYFFNNYNIPFDFPLKAAHMISARILNSYFVFRRSFVEDPAALGGGPLALRILVEDPGL